MKSKGFTLVELMVAIVIVGILAGIAVPNLFGHTAKAKASEVTPAAVTYVKLQQAYIIEHQSVGTWKKIGYEAPGKGETSNFKYSKGDISSSVKQKNWKVTLSGEGKIGWQAENIVGFDKCLLGNKWVVVVVADGDANVNFKSEVVSSKSSQYCVALTGDWVTTGSQVPENTEESETSIVDEPEPETPEEPGTPANSDQVAYKSCSSANGSGWLNGNKKGWEKDPAKKACLDLRASLKLSGVLVCKGKKETDDCNLEFSNAENECLYTENNCH